MQLNKETLECQSPTSVESKHWGCSRLPPLQQGAARSVGSCLMCFDKPSLALGGEVGAAPRLPERLPVVGQYLEQLVFSGLHDSRQRIVTEVISIWGKQEKSLLPSGPQS